MCIWNVAKNERHCEYCSYRGGCERFGPQSNLESDLNRYVSIMQELVGKGVMGKARISVFTWARYMIEYQLLLDGYEANAIGKITGKAGATIYYGKHQVLKMLAAPKMYARETECWTKFQERLNS